MFKIKVIGVIAALLAAGPALAQQSPKCAPRQVVVEALAKHHETTVAGGISAQGALIEIFASPKGGWSLVLTRPDGVSCMIDVGENWEQIPIQKGQGL